MNKRATLLLKLVLSPIVAAAMASAATAHQPAEKTTDHLVFASTNSLDLRYERLVTQKLCKKASDLGRAIVQPPFEGEFALSIYLNGGNADLAVVELVQAEKNIWYAASRLDHDLRVNPNVPVKRLNATMKRRVAFAVAEAIGHAIARTRAPVRSERVVVDGTRILFFAPANAKTKVRSVELDPAADGELSQALRRLVSLLEKYCDSPDTARQRISMKIEEQALLISGIR